MNGFIESIDSYFDDELPPERQEQLTRALKRDPEALRVFVRCVHLHHCLRVELIAKEALAELTGATEGVAGEAESEHTDSAAGNLVTFPSSRSRRDQTLGILALAACLALLLGAVAWLFPRVNDHPRLELTARVPIQVERAGELLTGRNEMKLRRDDLLRTGPGEVIINYGPEQTSLELRPSTELKLDPLSRGKVFELRRGEIKAEVARQRPFSPLLVRTRDAQVRVVGTRFDLAVTTNATTLQVSAGKIRFTRASDGKQISVSAGSQAVVAAGYEFVALPVPGQILHETWTNYPGTFLAVMTSDPTYAEHPNLSGSLTNFDTPFRAGRRFGERVRGYVYPPVTGQYRFRTQTTGPGQSFLFLSRDDTPEQRTPISEEDTTARGTRPAPPPPSFPLKAGHRYYIEVLHEGEAGGQVAVFWQRPGREREVIPGEFLAPFPAPSKKGQR